MNQRKEYSIMAENRLIGEYPVIGIRPTIDGRRGALRVRESVEDQTMNMAKSAAKLLSENIRYSNGEPVKVVIADTTIGRVAEAAACAENAFLNGLTQKATGKQVIALPIEATALGNLKIQMEVK